LIQYDVNDVFLSLKVFLLEFGTLSLPLCDKFALSNSLFLNALVLSVFRFLLSILTYA
jgi:hypothetical protein